MPAAEYERFSDAAHQAVVQAERVARLSGKDVVGLEHLLLALIDCDDDVRDRLLVAGVDRESVVAKLAEWDAASGGGSSSAAAPQPVAHAAFSQTLRRAVHLAGRMATQERSTAVVGRHLLGALIEVEDEFVLRLLVSLGTDPADLARRAATRPRRIELRIPSFDGDGSDGPDDGDDAAPRRRGLLATLLGR